MTPYDDIDLSQHWLRLWLVAWWHQAITNVDLSIVYSSDTHMRAVSQDISLSLTTKISLKITHLKFTLNLRWANVLTHSAYEYRTRQVLGWWLAMNDLLVYKLWFINASDVTDNAWYFDYLRCCGQIVRSIICIGISWHILTAKAWCCNWLGNTYIWQ